MIELNYQTYNKRFGWKGLKFNSWQEYAKVLGFLSNINHFDANIIKIYCDNMEGIWNRVVRVYYYDSMLWLEKELNALYKCSVSGVGKSTCRINCSNYINSLLNDYYFSILKKNIKITEEILPGETSYENKEILISYLQSLHIDNVIIKSVSENFDSGWNLLT